MHVADAPERLTFATEWPDLDGDCIVQLDQWLDGVLSPRLIIIDVFAKVRGAGSARETQYELDYKFAAKLQTLATLRGVAVVLVHHTRKQESEDPFDAVSGTRGLTGAADSVLVLKKDPGSQQPILYGRGRDLPEIESALIFDGEQGRWSVLGDAGMVAHTAERREILQVIGRAVDPMTPTEIAEALGKKRSTVNHTLTKLYEDGKVEKHSKGRYTLRPPLNSVHSVHSDNDTVNEVNGVVGGYRGETDDEAVPGFD
jgi:DNA-binding transcriptional ArsR family regulator